MKKQVLINSSISALIARLGHGDEICIADAGLPIPDQVMRIDLALVRSTPSFMDTLHAVTTEMMVEEMVIATELQASATPIYQELLSQIETLEVAQANSIVLESMSHEAFKRRTRQCKAVIRTGECTPYANIILRAGVSF